MLYNIFILIGQLSGLYSFYSRNFFFSQTMHFFNAIVQAINFTGSGLVSCIWFENSKRGKVTGLMLCAHQIGNLIILRLSTIVLNIGDIKQYMFIIQFIILTNNIIQVLLYKGEPWNYPNKQAKLIAQQMFVKNTVDFKFWFSILIKSLTDVKLQMVSFISGIYHWIIITFLISIKDTTEQAGFSGQGVEIGQYYSTGWILGLIFSGYITDIGIKSINFKIKICLFLVLATFFHLIYTLQFPNTQNGQIAWYSTLQIKQIIVFFFSITITSNLTMFYEFIIEISEGYPEQVGPTYFAMYVNLIFIAWFNSPQYKYFYINLIIQSSLLATGIMMLFIKEKVYNRRQDVNIK